MKLIWLKSIFLIGIFSSSILKSIEESPLIVIVLMIKNEESVIIETLRSYSADFKYFLIFDTGSQDKTIDIIKQFFEENTHLTGYLAQKEFIDFSTSRNYALDETEKVFPQAQFMLMPDAEWYLYNGQGLINFCKKHQNDTTDAYLVRGIFNNLDFYTTRLIRCKTGIRFHNQIHETLNRTVNQKVDSDVFFEVRVSPQGSQKSIRRWRRDLEILLDEYNKNPKNARNLFYLAQTYDCLGELQTAFYFYEQRRILSDDWIEENFETLCRMGRIAHVLAPLDSNFTDEQSLSYYLQAHILMPHRAEPLVHIAQIYWPNCIPLCFLFIRRAVELPYPINDSLFINKTLYDYDRYEILSKCASYMKEYELGERATRQALSLKQTPELYQNLDFYLKALNKKIDWSRLSSLYINQK
ncbi:MAG: hypothetical protein WA432_03250 [Candidatus Babeliaceae bacterium]